MRSTILSLRNHTVQFKGSTTSGSNGGDCRSGEMKERVFNSKEYNEMVGLILREKPNTLNLIL